MKETPKENFIKIRILTDDLDHVINVADISGVSYKGDPDNPTECHIRFNDGHSVDLNCKQEIKFPDDAENGSIIIAQPGTFIKKEGSETKLYMNWGALAVRYLLNERMARLNVFNS